MIWARVHSHEKALAHDEASGSSPIGQLAVLVRSVNQEQR
jgi:hypothetical protein